MIVETASAGCVMEYVVWASQDGVLSECLLMTVKPFSRQANADPLLSLIPSGKGRSTIFELLNSSATFSGGIEFQLDIKRPGHFPYQFRNWGIGIAKGANDRARKIVILRPRAADTVSMKSSIPLYS